MSRNPLARLAARAARLSLALLLVSLSVPVAPSPLEAKPRAARRGQGQARLIIITNFDATEIEIGKTSYPYEYIYGDQQGMIVPSNVTFRLVVSTSPEKRRTFNLNLDEGETRVLVVDLENMGAVAAAPPKPQAKAEAAEAPPAAEGSAEALTGFLGVASTPRGTVVVDGGPTENKTPARRIELPAGQHTVQVQFDDGAMSETKNVLIRSGINTSVYFRPPTGGTGEASDRSPSMATPSIAPAPPK